MIRNTIAFYTPKVVPVDTVFGAATLGIAGRSGAGECVTEYKERPHAIKVNGTYSECLRSIPYGNYRAAILLCGNAGGENEFLANLQDKLQCPIVGGGAAMDGSRGGLIAGGGEASILLIDDDTYEVQTSVKNIHDQVLGSGEVAFDDPRIIKTINGEEPAGWLKRQKEKLGISETDFEHFTLSDDLGVNAHLSRNGQMIVSGRDLEREMLIRYVRKADVYKSVYDFYNDTEDAIVFGCAGLKGITGELPPVKSLGLYLYGEICMVGNQSVFGNLMLSKLKLIKK